MRTKSIIIVFFIAAFIVSCETGSNPKTEAIKAKQKLIPLFEHEHIEPDVIYISHGYQNNHLPTLIKLKEFTDESNNVSYEENERFKSNEIVTSISKSYEFKMKFKPFPEIEIKDVKITEENRKLISSNAFFIVIPTYEEVLYIDNSNIETKSGKLLLEWLKTNISQVCIYEMINIWRLEHGFEPNDSIVGSLEKNIFKLDKTIDLNRQI